MTNTASDQGNAAYPSVLAPTCDTFNPPAEGSEPDCPVCRLKRQAFRDLCAFYLKGEA